MTEEKKDVKKEGEPSTPEEKEASKEVKTTPEVGDEKMNKMQGQIDNLNIALKQEREQAKDKVDPSKVTELENQLKEATDVIDKLKPLTDALNPFQEVEKEEDKDFLTAEQFNEKWEAKEKERKQQEFEQGKVKEYKSQISTLETEWDGKDGKPKYDDTEVLKWQQDNNKEYLAPEDAFAQMKKTEIIDYEVKKRQSGSPAVENVEQPSGTPSEHEPAEFKIKTEDDTRQAVREAMENADKEL